MPNRPVIRQDKNTTKIHIVYDASTTSNDSVLLLNDCLQVGPNLISKFFNILIRFPCYPIAMLGDIEKVFLMISIKDIDRDMFRFLWLKEPFNERSDIIQLHFTCLVFGFKPCRLYWVLSWLIIYRSFKPCIQGQWIRWNNPSMLMVWLLGDLMLLRCLKCIEIPRPSWEEEDST